MMLHKLRRAIHLANDKLPTAARRLPPRQNRPEIDGVSSGTAAVAHVNTTDWGLLKQLDNQKPASKKFLYPAGCPLSCRLEFCGFKRDPWLPSLRCRVVIPGPSYVLHVDVAALYPNFAGDHFAFSIQKERHRKKLAVRSQAPPGL
jgi:hypothetical protein